MRAAADKTFDKFVGNPPIAATEKPKTSSAAYAHDEVPHVADTTAASVADARGIGNDEPNLDVIYMAGRMEHESEKTDGSFG